ncbi:DUF2750 domain-containing protein [Xanthomonas campestris pv. campestris]|nr:DUF2750 domain-containing protein [Xanthomonas campestris pv. campestris]
MSISFGRWQTWKSFWGGFEDGWLQLGNDRGRKSIPFWPEEMFVRNYIEENKVSASPRRIELCHFLDRWVPGMEKDRVTILVFPIKESQGIQIAPIELSRRLKEELSQYE